MTDAEQRDAANYAAFRWFESVAPDLDFLAHQWRGRLLNAYHAGYLAGSKSKVGPAHEAQLQRLTEHLRWALDAQDCSPAATVWHAWAERVRQDLERVES